MCAHQSNTDNTSCVIVLCAYHVLEFGVVKGALTHNYRKQYSLSCPIALPYSILVLHSGEQNKDVDVCYALSHCYPACDVHV